MLGVLLQSFGTFDFASLLTQLDQLGFFSYVLPFLLIFAVVYAILSKVEIFKENRGASILIAVAIGLLSLQLNFVSEFFQNVFPKFGIGLTFLLLALILAGAFLPGDDKGKNSYFSWIFFGLGAIIFLIISILALTDMTITNYWWNEFGALVIVGVVVIVAMIMVMVMSKK